jgi:hypothetical protein
MAENTLDHALNLPHNLTKVHLKCGRAVVKALLSNLAPGGKTQIEFEMEEDGAMRSYSDFLVDFLLGGSRVNEGRFSPGKEELKFKLSRTEATFAIGNLSVKSPALAHGWNNRVWMILGETVEGRKFGKLDITLEDDVTYTGNGWKSTLGGAGEVGAVIYRSPEAGHFLAGLTGDDGILKQITELEFDKTVFSRTKFGNLVNVVKSRRGVLNKIVLGRDTVLGGGLAAKSNALRVAMDNTGRVDILSPR